MMTKLYKTNLHLLLLALFCVQFIQAQQTTVTSLADLLPYLDDNGADIKLAAGTYTITAQDIADGKFSNPLFLFEGSNSTYDFTGVTSLLASMSGGKNLTIYYVSEKVRDNYVSCVLSFWNNDNINPSGLPPLLEEIMSISKK